MIIILITGAQGSGKSTLAQNLLNTLQQKHSVEIMKFAAVLYEMHHAIRGILGRYNSDLAVSGETFIGIDGPLLQVLGTEWGRKTRGEDFWVNIMKQRVAKINHDYLIIDDVRFENELTAFDGTHRVFKIRLAAPEAVRKERAQKWRENTTHLSETGLDHIPNSDFSLTLNTVSYTATDTAKLAAYYIDEFTRQVP